MPSSKAIVVLIGNNGTIISKHDNNDITSEFVDKISDEKKVSLTDFFNKYPDLPIYVLLDTIDQTYKKKTYPSVRGSDLIKIANRDLLADGDKESLKSFIVLKNHKSLVKKNTTKKTDNVTKTDCLFITSSRSENISNWLNFIYTLPNRLIGIHMLPVESYSLFRKILESSVANKSKDILKIREANIFCFVIQTKTGGARQIVFSGSSIVFTRVVNYNFDEPNFAEKYSQDIYSTFEYLKRLYIDLTLEEFEVINIFPEKASSQIMQTKNIELNITNYTAQDVVNIIKNNKLKAEDDYIDTIISSVFVKSKKILKFTNQKIKSDENLNLAKIASYVLNFILGIALIATISVLFLSNKSLSEEIEKAQNEKISATNEFAKAKKLSLKGDPQESDKELSIERVVDMGRVEQGLGNLNHDFVKTYSKIKFSSNFDLKFNFFSFDLISFDSHSSNNLGVEKQLKLIGKLFNKSGDIETLFTEFDNFLVEMKKNLPEYDIRYNELPRNIDFNQKYYSFPIEFRIISKQNENRES